MSSPRRILPLDGLRGIAVALVVLCHVQAMSLLPQTLPWKLFVRVLNAGWFGVDIFFVLSGFLITTILLEAGPDWKRFYRNRAFRILPPFLAVLGAVLLFIPLPRSWVLLCYLFFLGNFTVIGLNEVGPLGHFWSLAVEEQFYLLWPQLVWRASRSKVLATALSLAVVSLLCRLAGELLGWDAYLIYKLTLTRLDGISLGCAVAAAGGMPAPRQWLLRWWKTLAWAAAAMLVAGFAALRCSYFLFDTRAQVLAIPPVIVLAAAVIFAAAEQRLPSRLAARLCSRPLVYLGRRSYALYLIHVPVYDWVAAAFSPRVAQFSATGRIFGWFALMLLAMGLSLALAELSWRLLEQPAQAWKKRLYGQEGDKGSGLPAEQQANVDAPRELLPEIETPLP